MEIPFFTFFVGGHGTLLLRSTNTTLLEMMEAQIDSLNSTIWICQKFSGIDKVDVVYAYLFDLDVYFLYVKGIITSHMHTFLKGSECQKRAVDKKQHLFYLNYFETVLEVSENFVRYMIVHECYRKILFAIICFEWFTVF